MRYLVHLADLHIRAGDVSVCRYDEYGQVFCNAVLAIREIALKLRTDTDDLGVVIVGDVFHNKGRIDAPGVHLFTQLITGLSALGHVYLVEGNHDVHQSDAEGFSLLDAFTAFFKSTPRVTFMRASGHYVSDDETCGFGVMSVRDVLEMGNTSGHVKDIPTFPDPFLFPKSVTHKIALYHGQVSNSHEDGHVGWGPVSCDWFRGYDVALLGDTHTRTVHNAVTNPHTSKHNRSSRQATNDICCLRHHHVAVDTQRLVWGYSGSLVQQNYGEPMNGHGFLLWDLENKKVSAFDVCNPIAYCSATDAHVIQNAIDAFTGRLLPTLINVRCPVDEFVAIKESVAQTCDVRFCGDVFAGSSSSSIKKYQIKDLKQYEAPLQHAFDTPEAWIKYIDTCCHDKDVVVAQRSVWTRWIMDPSNGLALDPLSLPEEGNCREKAQARNSKLIASIRKMLEITSDTSTKKTSSFSINHVEWSWLMCYGEDNWMNFAEQRSKVSIVSAPNAYGKSSFVDIVGIAMFGESVASCLPGSQLRNISITSSPEIKPYTRINFTVATDEEVYEIRRTFVYSASTATVKTIAELFRVHGTAGTQRIHSGKVAVDTWVKRHLGSASSFAMSCVVGAGTNNFFTLKHHEQMNLLDQHFNMSTIQSFVGVLDVARKDTKHVVDLVDTACRAKFVTNTNDTREALEREEENLRVVRSELDEATDKHYETFADVAGYRGVSLVTTTDDGSLVKLIPDLEKLKSRLEDGINDLMGLARDMKVPVPSIPDTQSQSTCESSINVVASHVQAVKEMTRVAKKFRSSWKEPPPPPIDDKSIEDLMAHMNLEDDGDANLEEKNVEDKNVLDLEDVVRFLKNDLEATDRALGIAMSEKKDLMENRMDAEHDRLLSMTNLEEWCDDYVRFCSTMERTEIERNIMHLQESIRAHEERVEQLGKLRSRLVALQESVDMVSNGTAPPYNEDCWACRQQGWKVKLDRDIENAKKVSARIEELLCWSPDGERTNDSIRAQRDLLAISTARSKEIGRMDLEAPTKMMLLEKRRKALRTAADMADIERDIENKMEIREGILRKLLDAQATIIRVKHRDSEGFGRKPIASILRSEVRKREQRQEFDTDVASMLSSIELGNSHKISVDRKLRRLYRMRTLASYEESRKNLQNIKGKVEMAEARVVRMRMERAAADDAERHVKEYKACISILEDRLALLVALIEAFSSYRYWVYSNDVLPRMSQHVAGTMSMVCPSWKVSVQETDDGFSWTLVEEDAGGRRVPVSTASGFQKFMLGISAKAAMSRMGVSSVRCMQLFVDEGFSSCDVDNMGRVPDFLHGLARWYDNVVITSHIVDVKEAAHVCIPISRDAKGHSKIAWGTKVQPVASEGPKRKK